MRLISILFLFVLSACGKAPEGATNNSSQKDAIFKSWTSTAPWWTLDLGAAAINDIGIARWTLAYGETCDSAIVMTANTMKIALSTKMSAPQATDLPCDYFDGDWTYSTASGDLEICQTTPSAEPCVTLR